MLALESNRDLKSRGSLCQQIQYCNQLVRAHTHTQTHTPLLPIACVQPPLPPLFAAAARTHAGELPSYLQRTPLPHTCRQRSSARNIDENAHQCKDTMAVDHVLGKEVATAVPFKHTSSASVCPPFDIAALQALEHGLCGFACYAFQTHLQHFSVSSVRHSCIYKPCLVHGLCEIACGSLEHTSSTPVHHKQKRTARAPALVIAASLKGEHTDEACSGRPGKEPPAASLFCPQCKCLIVCPSQHDQLPWSQPQQKKNV
eukprot:1154382-Pelagomonas_calceolata.AAC.1